MFINNEAALRGLLKEAPGPCYYLYGSNDYLVRQYARELVKRASGGSDSEMVVRRFDFQTATVDEVYDAALSVSFFGGNKCLFFPSFKPGELPPAELEKLTALLPSIPEGVTLVFAALETPSRNGKNSLFNRLDQNGVVIELSGREQGELSKFCQKQAALNGAILKPAVSTELIAYIGENMSTLANEIAKLSAYVGQDGEILPEHIRLLCTPSLGQSVFNIMKAVLRKDTVAAMSCLNALQQQRENAIAALGAIESSFLDLYRAKLADLKRIPPSKVAADFGYRGPSDFRLSRAASDAQRLTPAYLRRCLDILTQTDLDCKTLKTDAYELLEQTVIRLLDARQNTR